ncbi:MAG: hypothetical protein PHZ20_00775 [Bacilli bacterium]|nr:hypothetical protein [Bacilli bacterium]MDD4410983.1 hypothetical protein [Bacilli bacterium]
MRMKNKKVIIAIFIIVCVMVTATFIKLWFTSKSDDEVQIINEIKEYGYILEDNETDLHKEYFEELVTVLGEKDVDEEAYAELVTKLFISDFYNLDNKVTKNNVGGIQYTYSKAQENMVLKAKDTIYKYIENNIDNGRTQKLPIVSNVEVKNIEQLEFEYEAEVDDEAFEIELNWTYKEDLGYQSEAVMILIHEDNKLAIAEIRLLEE